VTEDALKTLILTGASRGIGHATVKRFSQEGWRIITCSREDVPDECRRDPNWNRHITVDLADPRAVETFVAEANAALAGAPLHALVNNAAVSPKTAFKERLGILNGALDAWRVISLRRPSIVIGVGGFLGAGEHDVAVKFDELKWSNGAATTGSAASEPKIPARTYPDHAVLNATKDQLKSMPNFNYSK